MPRKRQKNWEGEWTSSFAEDCKVNAELRKLTNSAGWVAATSKPDSRWAMTSSVDVINFVMIWCHWNRSCITRIFPSSLRGIAIIFTNFENFIMNPTKISHRALSLFETRIRNGTSQLTSGYAINGKFRKWNLSLMFIWRITNVVENNTSLNLPVSFENYKNGQECKFWFCKVMSCVWNKHLS